MINTITLDVLTVAVSEVTGGEGREKGMYKILTLEKNLLCLEN